MDLDAGDSRGRHRRSSWSGVVSEKVQKKAEGMADGGQGDSVR